MHVTRVVLGSRRAWGNCCRLRRYTELTAFLPPSLTTTALQPTEGMFPRLSVSQCRDAGGPRAQLSTRQHLPLWSHPHEEGREDCCGGQRRSGGASPALLRVAPGPGTQQHSWPWLCLARESTPCTRLLCMVAVWTRGSVHGNHSRLLPTGGPTGGRRSRSALALPGT